MEVIKKIGNIILDVLIGLISICFIFALYHYISIKVLDNPYTNFFGYTYFNIKTGSMADTINIDDYVFVKITKDVKVDDVVSFVLDGKIITHRIIDIDEEGRYITKGDANNTEDAPVTSEQIVGKVIKVGNGYGTLLKVITDPVVIIPFFAAIIFINLAFSSGKKRIQMMEMQKSKEN